jgi:hypothetical protein
MMAGKRRRPVHCGGWECDGVAKWVKDWQLGAEYTQPEPGYLCPECGWAANADTADQLELTFVDDGRIRGADDVPPRLALCAQSAAANPYLNEFDLQVYQLYLETGAEHNSVEIIASDYWVAERLGFDRSRVRRSRARLGHFKHVKRLTPKEVRMYAVQEQLARRRAEKKRLPIVLEIRKGPDGWPVCAECGGPIPDIQRVSKAYCSGRCRSAGFRKRGIDIDAITAPLRAAKR